MAAKKTSAEEAREQAEEAALGSMLDGAFGAMAVSYTHLTLPTNREV